MASHGRIFGDEPPRGGNTPTERLHPSGALGGGGDGTYRRWWIGGVLLSGAFLGTALLASRFDYGQPPDGVAVGVLLTLLLGAGAVYLAVVGDGRRAPSGWQGLAWLVGVGLVIRLTMFATAPILEDDHYRYLWDGAVLAGGHNPYRFAPSVVAAGVPADLPDTLERMAAEQASLVQRINYPWLRTIYPPVAQAFFALAHLAAPFSLTAWRLVLLAVDGSTLVLLGYLLRVTGGSLRGLAVYWWNPLAVKELYNSAHMEVLIFPFLLAAVLLAIHRRHRWAALALGLAVGTKIWPGLLLPLLLRPLWGRWRRLAGATAVFALTVALGLLPFWLGGLDGRSGLTAYSRSWEMNDALFMVVQQVATALPGDPRLTARGGAAALVLAWAVWQARSVPATPHALCRRAQAVILALFMLSPTQFPWYALWLLPLCAVHPQPAVRLLFALMPLYYLRFYLDARGLTALYDNRLVWLQYVPVWFLLAVEHHRGRRNSPVAGRAP